MGIKKTSITFSILAEDYGTLKYLRSETLDMIKKFYGEEALQRILNSGAYEQYPSSEYSGSELVPKAYLSAGIFEWMPDMTEESELEEYITRYMKENGMWPVDITLDVMVRYTKEVALPQFISAGLLEL